MVLIYSLCFLLLFSPYISNNFGIILFFFIITLLSVFFSSLLCSFLVQYYLIILIFSLALQPPWALASAFQFHDHFTDGRTPWTSDQLVARPLPKHSTTQTQNKHIHTPHIHALCEIRTHDPSFRASEDSSCPRTPDYCDPLDYFLTFLFLSFFSEIRKWNWSGQ
jgi:hypothetical protein